MSYLLDSNALLWARTSKKKLGSSLIALLENPDESIYYSVVSPWELFIKYTKGKLPLPPDFFDTMPNLGFDCLPIEEKHIDALRSLPSLHGDPFDRMLVAQAMAEKMTLITSDKRLAAYPVKTLLVAA